MATGITVFLNVGEPSLDDVANQIQENAQAWSANDAVLMYHAGNPWLVLSFELGSPLKMKSKFADALKVAAELSKSFRADSISVNFQSAVDYVQYAHFIEGKLGRKLEYCPEGGGWLAVEGEPEDWEGDALFGDPSQVDYLRDQLEDETDPDERDHIQREIAAFESHRIEPGNANPLFSPFKVGKAFGLPGYGPERLNPSAMASWWTFRERV